VAKARSDCNMEVEEKRARGTIRRVADSGGLLLFLGIPNFEIVCREYLDTGGGSIGGTLGWHRYIATPTVIQTGTLSGG
jgi:hypothetical protein